MQGLSASWTSSWLKPREACIFRSRPAPVVPLANPTLPQPTTRESAVVHSSQGSVPTCGPGWQKARAPSNSLQPPSGHFRRPGARCGVALARARRRSNAATLLLTRPPTPRPNTTKRHLARPARVVCALRLVAMPAPAPFSRRRWRLPASWHGADERGIHYHLGPSPGVRTACDDVDSLP